MKTEYIKIIKQLNTKDTAIAIGVSENMIDKYKRGFSTPPIEALVKFDEDFNIPVRAWLDIKNEYLKNKKVK